MSLIIIFVCIALGVQIYFLYDSLQKARQMKDVLAEKGKCKVEDYYIPSTEFGNTSYERVLLDKTFYTDPAYRNEDGQFSPYDLRGKKEKVSLVRIPANDDTTAKIESSVNNYLIRNKGMASDFSIIKDMVERNCTMIEDEIDTQTPFPLYIGLMCTMMGIIVGIVSISFSAGGFAAFVENPVNHIGTLMNDVAAAMIASFFGILFTTGISYRAKNTKKIVEEHKNDFYSWFQTELMPIISRENASEGIRRLEDNLKKFNQTFSQNVSGLTHSVSAVASTATDQRKLLETIDRLDLNKMATANVRILTTFKESVAELDKFQGYLTYANEQLNKMKKNNDAVNEIAISMEESTKKTVAKLQEAINKQMESLKESLQQSSNEMKLLVENEKRLVSSQGSKLETFFNTLQDLKPVINGLQDWRQELQRQNQTLKSLVQAISSMPRPDGKGGNTVLEVRNNGSSFWQKIIAVVLFALLAINGFTAWNAYNAQSEDTTQKTEVADNAKADSVSTSQQAVAPQKKPDVIVTQNPRTPQETAPNN